MLAFYANKSTEQKNLYKRSIEKIGKLSRLYSDNDSPYLYYRAHERMFCSVFNAKDLSRSDISYDASADGIGIGLKTFLHGNGATFQKVAEFDSEGHKILSIKKDKSTLEALYKVAQLRNSRLDLAKNITNCKRQLYHLITRKPGAMLIYEYPMDYININNIRIIAERNNSVTFTDKINEYSFLFSKSTLLEKFKLSEPLDVIPVEITNEPLGELGVESNMETTDSENCIYLPLYSTTDNTVPEKSQLNQWNAGGRIRDPDEVYIPIPAIIHKKYAGFLPYEYNKEIKGSSKDSPSFNIELPNGQKLKCKVAQSGGKALMSDPNKALGKWILRDVLTLEQGQLLTKAKLDELGIDSVKITKIDNSNFQLDFAKTGSYNDFIEELN